MSLTTEWRRRLKRWRQELTRHFYRLLGSIDLSGFVTADQLMVDEASLRRFEPKCTVTRCALTTSLPV